MGLLLQPRRIPHYSNLPPIINNYYNVQPPYYSKPSYYSGIKSKSIKFTSEIEENVSLLFLDITITLENNKFVTSVHRKATFSGVLTNFESFIGEMHKGGLIETLLHRSFRLCSSYENFHQEIETLNSIIKTSRINV